MADTRYYSLDALVEAGRNAIVGAGIVGLDGEAHKTFKMPYKEGHALEFQFEAFNVLNHPNWQMPNLNILAGQRSPGRRPETPIRASERSRQHRLRCGKFLLAPGNKKMVR